MKLRHILSFLVILTLLSSIVSAGFFGSLLSIITGRSIGEDGFSVEYSANLDLTGSSTCNREEQAYTLKSYGTDLIEIADAGVKTKEVYATIGGCKGLYYKDMETGKPVSLKAVGADLIIGNRHYSLSITTNIDFSPLYGAGYKRIETTALKSDEKTMKLENGLGKTDIVYMFQSGTKSAIIYDLDSEMLTVPSAKEKITFDMSPVLIPKKVAEPAATTPTKETTVTTAWDEKRVSEIETQLLSLSDKVDLLTEKVSILNGEEPVKEQKGLWARVFQG